MKSFFLILASLLVLTACTVPGPSDFETTTKPLSEDEFLVVWRFSRTAKEWEVLDKSPDHKVEMEAAMKPLFQQLIPQIFSDIKAGKLVIREEEDMTELDENPIKDVPARMGEFYEGSWQNLKPFMETFHITQRRNLFTSGFPAIELEFELIAQDPNGKFPERRLGSVRVEDLLELDYSIEVEGQKYELITYLNQTIKYGYPIAYFYRNIQNGLRTLEEAFGTKEYLLEGKWVSIPWIAGESNFTGLEMGPALEAELEKFVGAYNFPDALSAMEKESNQIIKGTLKVRSFTPESATNHFSPHKRYVYLDWAHKGNYLSFFPLENQSFFATSGEQMKFEKVEGKMRMTFTDAEGNEIIGHRE